jgi:hypothetical protein
MSRSRIKQHFPGRAPTRVVEEPRQHHNPPRSMSAPQKINLSTVFAGQAVGIKELEEGIWLVSFMDYVWRRRRDLNPRDPFGSNGFQDRRFQPLTHSSVFNCNVFCELAASLLHSPPLLLHVGARCSRFVAVLASFPTATTFEARLECV